MTNAYRRVYAVLITLWLLGICRIANTDHLDDALALQVAAEFQDVHISHILKFFSHVTGAQFILDESVIAPVSGGSPTKEKELVTDGRIQHILFENVSLKDALDKVLTPLGLAYTRRADALWISTPDRVRIYARPSDRLADPNPFEKTIIGFEEKDKANPPAKGGIEFYGSSSIRFWKTDEAFPDLHILNRGFGGSQASDALLYADRMVIKYEPRLVVYYEGDNDLNAGKTPQQVFADTKAFLEKVHAALPKTKFIYVCIKPSIARWSNIDKVRETNKMVRDYAAKTDYITYLDVEPIMLGPDGKPKPDIFVTDNLHMNDKGYALWNDLIRPMLK